jgi:von Willebrand factor type A domain
MVELFYLDKEGFSSSQLFLILLDVSSTVSKQKLEILKSGALRFLDQIDSDCFFSICTFAGVVEFLTIQSGEPANKECKEKAKSRINDLSSAEGQYAMCLGTAMKDILARITGRENCPKSMVIFGNGNMDYDLDVTFDEVVKDPTVRVSAIGIGNGSADGFLQKTVTKGRGIFDVLLTKQDIEAIISNFYKRLVQATFTNVRFEIKDQTVLEVFPKVDPSATFLKETAFEVFIYAKHAELMSIPGETLLMKYLDQEDNKEKSVTISLKREDELAPEDMYAVCIHELILQRHAISNQQFIDALTSVYGYRWSIQLAVDNNILTSETAYLIKSYTPAELQKAEEDAAKSIVAKANKKVTVSNAVPEDSLQAKASPTKTVYGKSSKMPLNRMGSGSRRGYPAMTGNTSRTGSESQSMTSVNPITGMEQILFFGKDPTELRMNDDSRNDSKTVRVSISLPTQGQHDNLFPDENPFGGHISQAMGSAEVKKTDEDTLKRFAELQEDEGNWIKNAIYELLGTNDATVEDTCDKMAFETKSVVKALLCWYFIKTRYSTIEASADILNKAMEYLLETGEFDDEDDVEEKAKKAASYCRLAIN